MLNEILCLCVANEANHTNRLMTLDEVSENVTILLAFYHPDNQSDCDQLNQLQQNGVELIALVDADDTRQLPERAFAMICCDDAKFIAQSICNAVTPENSVIAIDLVDLLATLKGNVFYYQRFTSGGDHRIQMIIDQCKNIRSAPSLEHCFCHGDFDMNELIELFSDCDAEVSLSFTLDHDFAVDDEIIVDMLYSPISKSDSDSSHEIQA
ncbi:hypothetical protein NGM44_10420 [Moraxella sp. FZFQ2102]|uniref:hypothetical protein n=1 Tax=Moraxella sp. FZFQ2102 TaxID=2953752 RepID=UPI00209C66F4|nr:hypothetical protein [Moraxella sp. FZFQ2102]USZ14747.1 hypothetical protein NGM44_10420 [Moraxella sp. FZFQ2102]